MLGLVLLFSLINYYFNDGFNGPTIFNIFVFVVAVAIFFKKPVNLYWLLASVGGYVLIFYLDVNRFMLVTSNYDTVQDLFWDNASSIVLCTVFIFIGIHHLIINYQHQQNNLLELQRENEQNLAELTSLNSKKDELIAILSHDLRGPVATLRATLELADEGVLDQEDLSKILFGLKSQSFQLSQVLDNTLAWVMAEIETTTNEKQLVDLRELGELMCDTMRVQAEQKNQKLSFEFVGDNKSVLLETKEVKIILKNLLDNAIKFTKTGEMIQLKLIFSFNQIRWEVRNPGEIIPEDKRAHLFKFRSQSSIGTSQEKGTGIGLSLCKKIADSLGMNLGYAVDGEKQNVFFLEINQNNPEAFRTMSTNDQ
jgi:signal transduction histidine kinase